LDIGSASPNDIRVIVELDKRYFRYTDIVGEDVFRAWQHKNNSVFTVIRTGKEVAGYYALLPLKSKALQGIINGTLREKEIKPTDILGKEQERQIQELYLYSVAMDNRYSKATWLLIRHLEQYLETLVTKGCLTVVYAVAVTSEGEKLLKKLGFKNIKDANQRPDRHPLYSRNLSQVRENKSSIFARRFSSAVDRSNVDD